MERNLVYRDLPTSVQKGLERFCSQLQEALRDQLVSIVLYGERAKQDEYHPGISKVDVMVVLKEVTVEALHKASLPVRKATRNFRLTTMVLSESDLRRSTDVFPTKFLDMQQHHRVLWGKDVLTGLPISKEHLRLRCEQEIKNLVLRLRSFYVQRAHRRQLIADTLTGSVTAFLRSLSSLILLKAGASPHLEAEIVKAAGEALELDIRPLEEALALKRGRYKPAPPELEKLYDAFMATVDKAADIADQL